MSPGSGGQGGAPGAGAGSSRLSLVMMAKDEEKNLPRALKSAAPWVDEIVLVDTGSTDATVKIAKGFGAKVHLHPWQNDFSLHRNQALSYATGDWCLQLDADEELDQATAPLIGKLIAGGRAEGFWLEMYNITAGRPGSLSYLLRLFKKSPEARYFQRMHNQLKVPGRHASCGVRFFHYGYDLDPAAMAKKHARRMDMVTRWLKEEPDNWNVHYRAAQTMALKPVLNAEDRKSSLKYLAAHGLKALELAEAEGLKPRDCLQLFPQLVEALALLKADPPLGLILEKWGGAAPDNLDFWYFFTEYHLARRDWEQVERCSDEYFRRRETLSEFMRENPRLEVYTAGRGSLVAVALLLALAHLGQRQKAAEILQYLARQPDGEAAAKAAAKRMLRDGLGAFALFLAEAAVSLAPAWKWPAEPARKP